MKGILFALWGVLMLTASGWSAAAGLKLTVLVDNTAHAPGTKGRWGFACLVENAGPAPILFDTGPDAAVLAENARRLGVDLGAVGWVVLSHEHHDHIGGLAAALAAAPRATICPLGAFAAALAPAVRKAGAALKPLDEPTELCPGVWTTGALGRRIPEQALVLDTPDGLVVITGCAHPGVVEMVDRACTLRKGAIRLVLGGFHLGGLDDTAVDAVIAAFRSRNVAFVAPTHCTGDRAIARFQAAFGDRFVPAGSGRVIEPARLGARR